MVKVLIKKLAMGPGIRQVVGHVCELPDEVARLKVAAGEAEYVHPGPPSAAKAQDARAAGTAEAPAGEDAAQSRTGRRARRSRRG